MKIVYKNKIRLINKEFLLTQENIFQDVLNLDKKENIKWISGQNLSKVS